MKEKDVVKKEVVKKVPENVEAVELEDQDLDDVAGGVIGEIGDNNVVQCGCNVVQGCSC